MHGEEVSHATKCQLLIRHHFAHSACSGYCHFFSCAHFPRYILNSLLFSTNHKIIRPSRRILACKSRALRISYNQNLNAYYYLCPKPNKLSSRDYTERFSFTINGICIFTLNTRAMAAASAHQRKVRTCCGGNNIRFHSQAKQLQLLNRKQQ